MRRSQRAKTWMVVALWVAAIYSTLGVVRPVCEWLKVHTPFPWVVNGLLAVIVLGLFIILRRAAPRLTLTSYFGLAVVAGLYVVAARLVAPHAEEKIHFIQYGVLAYLVLRALQQEHLPRTAIYPLAFLITALFGWGDEGIQHLLPNRYFEWKDVQLNAISAALGLALVRILKRGQTPLSLFSKEAHSREG